MTPEDKIVAAIERNTEAIQRCSEDIDKFRSELGSVGMWLFFIWIVLLSGVGCPRAKAAPLLPPLGYEIGEPPAPPPNPNLQYWYTMDVPGPQGVLPQEVFAPRLVAQLASEPAVETPEPGTWWLVGFVFIMAAGVMVLKNIAVEGIREWELWAKRCAQYRLALEDIAATYTDTEGLRRIARKALEESK